MAQETWALKLDAELKEKIQEIVKSDFDSSKDFMEQLVSIYELNQLKQGENVLSQEVEELEMLTRRINHIFVNANAKINTVLSDKDTKAEQQVELKQRLIEKLQGDISKLEEDNTRISEINDTLVNSNEKYIQEVNQFTKSNLTLEDLVAEYKEKNDTLAGLLAEYKQDRELNKELTASNKELENRLSELNIVTKEQAKQILDADQRIRDIERECDIKLQGIINKHSEEIDTVKAKAEIESNKRILELQTEFQAKLQSMQEKFNTEIEQYQAKYKSLLENIEKQKLQEEQ